VLKVEETSKERLRLFIKSTGITQAKFERACGLSNGYVNALKSSPTADAMKKILDAFPDLNLYWLILGEGGMLRSKQQSTGYNISNNNVVVNSGTDADIKERVLAYIRHRGITIKKFEESCGLSSGYISSMRHGFGRNKLSNVLSTYPDLNREWLLYGEGEMLRTQSVGDIVGSNVAGVNVSGTDIQINPNAYDTLLEIVRTSQKSTEKFQEQIDRLLNLLEKADK